jgi:CheY-like chemotaxis protein
VAKILVIDDDAGIRRTVSRILHRAGHEVAEAQDGLEGGEMFRASRPDIVVTDIFMPQKEGIELIRDFRRDHPSTLILVISGGSTTVAGKPSVPHYLGMAQALGADGALAKPFRADDLLREIDRLLQGRTPVL